VVDVLPGTLRSSTIVQRRFRRDLTIIVALAALVRFVYALFVKGDAQLKGDEPFFHLTADWLSKGYGFTAAPHSGIPSALHPPLFSIALVPASVISGGSSVVLQRCTVALIGTVTVAVVGFLGRAVAGPEVGLLAALFAALLPVLWVNDGVLLSESLAGLLVTLFLLGCYSYLHHPRWQTAVLVGLVCGAAALTRTELLYLVVIALCLPLIADRSSVALRDCACIAIAALVLIGPWVLYNVSRFEQPVLISTNLGGILCGANNHTTYSSEALGLWERVSCPTPTTKPRDQSELTDDWTHAGLDYMTSHAGQVPLVVATRLARMTGLYAPNQTAAFEQETGARPKVLSWLIFFVQFLLLPLAALGAVRLHRKHVQLFPLLAVVGATFVVGALFYGELRYRVAADIPVIVLAAACILPNRIRTTSTLAHRHDTRELHY
jgi:4-amino-4-deoxy-L-arabinose transferase-like glycosyltransferase